MVAESFDDRAPEEVFAPTNLPDQRGLHTRIVSVRGERADERGAHELRLLTLKRVE